MTALIRLNFVLAVIFVLGAIAIPAVYNHAYPRASSLQDNAEFRRNVDSISDIEHLRKVLYTVVVGTDKVVVANKEFTDSSVHLLSVLLVVAAVGFGGSAVWLYLLRRKMGIGV
jgi:hypothetical protein